MAAPETQKTDQAQKAKAPAAGGAGTPSGRPPAPKRGGGGLFARLLLSAVLLLVVLGVAGYGALVFRDADPRIGEAASYVDQGVSQAQSALGKAQTMVADLTGSGAPKPAPEAEKPAETAQTAPAATSNPTSNPTWDAPKEAEKPAETPAAAPQPAPEPVKPVEEAKPVEAPKPIEAAKPAEPVKAPEPLAMPAPAMIVPPPAAPAAEARDADGFTARDLIAALEGRIEALNDEVQALRQKLDAPKNETRAAPEASEPRKGQTGSVTDISGAEIALAFALHRDLDAGRPFTAEMSGFSRLGTTPAPAPILVELSETGAPTAAQLLEEFKAVAKKLRANGPHASAHDAGALADHILEGASKLVKVRPTTGHAEPESFDGKLDRIEAALAHGDFAEAERLFESLPEAARDEASAFGKSLHQRHEAAKAAEELLNSAIAALGKK